MNAKGLLVRRVLLARRSWLGWALAIVLGLAGVALGGARQLWVQVFGKDIVLDEKTVVRVKALREGKHLYIDRCPSEKHRPMGIRDSEPIKSMNR